jgi:hypothetical protein
MNEHVVTVASEDLAHDGRNGLHPLPCLTPDPDGYIKTHDPSPPTSYSLLIVFLQFSIGSGPSKWGRSFIFAQAMLYSFLGTWSTPRSGVGEVMVR